MVPALRSRRGQSRAEVTCPPRRPIPHGRRSSPPLKSALQQVIRFQETLTFTPVCFRSPDFRQRVTRRPGQVGPSGEQRVRDDATRQPPCAGGTASASRGGGISRDQSRSLPPQPQAPGLSARRALGTQGREAAAMTRGMVAAGVLIKKEWTGGWVDEWVEDGWVDR